MYSKIRSATSLYEKYSRPSLASLLRILRADVSYTKAKDCSLFYIEQGEMKEVIDLTSGFGSAFFGHNDPDLKSVMIEQLQSDVPFVVQGSIRDKASQLCKRLHDMLSARTGRGYKSILCNTGAEAVETALKAACFRDSKRKQTFMDTFTSKCFSLEQRFEQGDVSIDPAFVEFLKQEGGATGSESVHELFLLLEGLVHRLINQPPISISLKRGYHGKSTGALQVTHSNIFRDDFKGFGLPAVFVDPAVKADLDAAIEQATLNIPTPTITDGVLMLDSSGWVNIASMIVEPIQGEAGIHPVPEDFLKHARSLATQHDFLLVCDEIQTGTGRTGRFLCSEKYDFYFDIYLLGKSLGGGLTKISSACIDDDVYEEGFDVIHTTTFSEDDISSAVAIEALQKLEETDLLDQAAEKGEFILQELKTLQSDYPSVVKAVRGEGLLIGLELSHQEVSSSNVLYNLTLNNMLGRVLASYILTRHNCRFLASISGGNTIRIQPPATISYSQLKTALNALREGIDLIAKADAGNLISHIIAPDKYQIDGREDFSGSNKWLPESAVADIKKKVTFIATPASSQDIVDIDPSLARFTESETDILVESLAVLNIPVRLPGRIMRSREGEEVVFYLVSVPYTPKMIAELYVKKELQEVNDSISQLREYAISKGHSHFGLGSFTSIVTKNGLDLKTNKISVTTGNSLTVVSSAEATFTSAKQQGLSPKDFRLAIIGATGNIGSMYATYASGICSKITLIGREGADSRLLSIAGQVYEHILAHPENCQALYSSLKDKLGDSRLASLMSLPSDELYNAVNLELNDDAPIKVSTDLQSAASSNIVICTTNSSQKILFPEMVGSHPTIISDVSFPPDVDTSVAQMPNVTVLHGGTVDISSVFDDRFRSIPTLGYQEGFACMSETILLGLSASQGHYSYGKLEIDKLYNIKDIASDFGFILDKPKAVNTVFG